MYHTNTQRPTHGSLGHSPLHFRDQKVVSQDNNS